MKRGPGKPGHRSEGKPAIEPEVGLSQGRFLSDYPTLDTWGEVGAGFGQSTHIMRPHLGQGQTGKTPRLSGRQPTGPAFER